MKAHRFDLIRSSILHQAHSALLLVLLLACSDARTAPPTGPHLALFAHGLKAPLWVTAPPGDPRVFIVEQPGRIRIVKDGQLLGTPFLDLTDRVSYGGERGLLSVAFHPHYSTNGFLYVTTPINTATLISNATR